MNPKEIQFEKYWRAKIAEEIAEAMRTSPEINAFGVYMLVKQA